MKQLNVTLSHLREVFERLPDMWATELAIVDRIEKMEWRGKRAGREKVLDIYQLGIDFGAEFAFTALRVSDPQPLADQIARFICIDIATAGLKAHPNFFRAYPEQWQENLRNFIARGGDLMEWESWCQRIRSDNRFSEVGNRLADRVVAAVCGRQNHPDIEEGGLEGLIDAVDELAWLYVQADARYTSARRIANLAAALETRWQSGTRLEFEFIDEIEAAMEELEEQLTPEHEQRALGVAWASLVLHTRGETIRPIAPIPAQDENDQG